MNVYCINPLIDARWDALVQQHPDASVFHAGAWMRALSSSYGYTCGALTTSGPNEPLTNGIPFCQVTSWLTGSRIVSMPFADHCQPLLDKQNSTEDLLNAFAKDAKAKKWKYAELRLLRPLEETGYEGPLHPSSSFAFHHLDLTPGVEEILQSFHKTKVQQMIRKAPRMGLTIEHGQSEALLGDFYSLLLMTRRRHQVPPQPSFWFQNLMRHFGNDLEIWVARREGKPIASILTLASAKTVVYKYGCSDPAFHNLGGVQALIWEAIQYAKTRHAKVFDFGRSDLSNQGLISYKNQWGTEMTTVQYYRNHITKETHTTHDSASGLTKRLFSTLPDSCLVAAGRLLYRHMG